METNPELQLAWQFIENTGTHLFLTGKAGTGKTTFLRQLKERSPKRMVVLAPTGIAAINAGGVTIHSFFQLPLAPYVPDTTFNSAQNHYRFGKEKRKIIRSMDLLVIDEISMVRADLLDAVDAALRRYRDRDKPFGGVQLLMIGDLQQLAPVVKDDEWEMLRKYYETPYFFASNALKQTNYLTIELKTVYRQSDSYFLSLLNKIRENKADDAVLADLNRRYQPGFRPDKEEGYIRLTTHNYRAQHVNDRELASLPGGASRFKAEVTGNFPEYAYPADPVLVLKEGAQIMFLKNDTSGAQKYYNGMIGEVVTINAGGISVRKKGEQKAFVLGMEEWSNSKYVLDEGSKEISEVVEGTFRQYPVRLAWAITIHKSQGLTFDRAIIDAAGSFAHGQTYVALSRCKTLEGLVLETPLRKEAIISDSLVDSFTREAERHEPGTQQLHDMQRAYFLDLLGELFNFYSLEQAYKRLLRLMDEDLYKLYPRQLAEYKELAPHLRVKVVEVAQKFKNQYTRLVSEKEEYQTDATLQQRIHSGATYFFDALTPIRTLLDKTSMPLDNKELKKLLNERKGALDDALYIKEELLGALRTEPFAVTDYLKRKAKATLEMEREGSAAPASKTSNERRERKARTPGSETPRGRMKVEVPTDILNPDLYRALSEWRTEKARSIGQPVYTIMQQKALMGIVNLLPDTPQALQAIPYFGAKGVEKYGFEILSIVRRYMKEHRMERPEMKEIFVPSTSKAERKDTRTISYEMFKQGMTIDEIAKQRELVTGTIAGHLEGYVRSGEIKVEQVVSAEHIDKIRRYHQAHADAGVTDIKVALGDEVSYADVRFVLADVRG
ncbi:MAG: helix-turn-helix domain-containing protein [Mediterranea sp.]|jgi:hypothetical protein|nr:helix-turn-helix domain-containing protein [Mediterranea sp.]